MPRTITSREYNRTDFYPPMPVLQIGISRAGRSTPVITIEAIIDTGSDGTMLPLSILEQAKSQYIDSAFIRGITGQRQKVALYLVTIHINHYLVHAIQAAALPNNEFAILGRDVLNQLNLMLNGTATTTDVIE